MKTNLLKTSLVGVALVAFLGVPTAMADGPQSSQGFQVSWDWLPTSADAFLNGAVGDVCSGGTYELSEAELLELFPLLQTGDEQSHQIRTVSGCENHCTCGACIVIQGQVACSACYSCCVADTGCDAKCSADLANQITTSHCQCIPPAGGLSADAEYQPEPSAALDAGVVTSLAPEL